MSLFRLASAFFSAARLERTLEIGSGAQQFIQDYEVGGPRHGHPVVIVLPHMTMSEAATLLPALAKGLKTVHAIFRPLNQPSINRWVTAEREKFGAKMISRRSGFNGAMAALRRGEMVAVLFDQDAATRGSIITFMDRVVSATDLPALMAHRFGADVFLMLPERQSFWRAKLNFTPIPLGEAPVDVTIAAHDALEQYLRRNQETAADWLWLHNRWHYAYKPHRRFNLPEKRNQLDRVSQLHGSPSISRKTRFWVRLPDKLSDLVMALPVLRAIRVGRPDFHFTILGQPAFKPAVDRFGVADHFIELPDRGLGYLKKFYGMRGFYPDTYLLLTDSLQGDLEAFCTRCQQRFGIVRAGKRRRLLSNPFYLPKEIEETQTHQTLVWEMMARHYGLTVPLDYEPLPAGEIARIPNRVGLFCGDGSPSEKLWPMTHWRELLSQLIKRHPAVEIVLYGNSADCDLASKLCQGYSPTQVINLNGQKDLGELCNELSACAVVAGCDNGGLHLANMLGTPLVAAFGATNRLASEPVFSSPRIILQPEDCTPTGGMPVDLVSPERMLVGILKHLT